MKQKLLILTFILILSATLQSVLSAQNRSRESSPADSGKTKNGKADIGKTAMDALSNALKNKDVAALKKSIDSAENLCLHYSLELPPILLLARAEYFLMTDDSQNALKEADIAGKMADKNGDHEALAWYFNFIGRYSYRAKSFSASLDNLDKSTMTAEKRKIRGIIPFNWLCKADVFSATGEWNKYLDSYYKVIEAGEREKDTFFIELGLFQLGTLLTEKERHYKEADSILNRCLQLSFATNDSVFTARALANLGWNEYLEKNFDKAISLYKKSLSYSIPSKTRTLSANALGNLGTIYRDLGRNETALKYYKSAIEQASPGNIVRELSWIYGDMSNMYLQEKDTANAYLSFVQFKKYSDLLLIKSSSEGLADARIKYESETHSKELELLSLRLKNQKLLIYGYTGLLLLSIAIAILIYSRSRINARHKIADMNRKISELTQANLRQQMNPHFIFNTLNSIQYYMYQHDKLATNNYLTMFSNLMRRVLENSRHTSIPLRDELEALRLYLDLEKIRFKDKFEYIIKVDEDIDTLLFKVPAMLIQPYVENSICHGVMPMEGKGLVRIEMKLNQKYILCTIEDNGIGRDASRERRMKDNDGRESLGTSIVSSRLDLVNSLYGTTLMTNYTDLRDENGEATGTLVEIHIPIMS